MLACMHVACLLWHPSGGSCQDGKGYDGKRFEGGEPATGVVTWWGGGAGV